MSDLLPGLVVEDLSLGQSLSKDLSLLSHSLPCLRERNKVAANEAGVRPPLPSGRGWPALQGTACASGVRLPWDILLDEMQESVQAASEDVVGGLWACYSGVEIARDL